jgi:hypothetical protein
MLMSVAINNQVSGDIAPALIDDQAFSTSSALLQNDWIVDTGCSNHATGTLSYFTELKRGNFGVCRGIGGSVRFEGISTVKIPIPGLNSRLTFLVLSNVKYCPAMGPFSLISVS